ncbi:AraC family transcriptional regulator [Pseudomonas sp. PS1]|uniref:AraC family transcriptional regulator n=1 Tax=Stutzerimonas marianensis TaxID=2929513 RepID=A0A9X1W0F1_9GAMM|nr:AraC family transcriptional regulator [Pseudomonas marianensis]MCJ0972372.1 AraC family transcriptional regulator [Pseudomonas marianensis]
MNQRTTSSSWANGIVQALSLGGVDCHALFDELGLDYQALQDADARFPQDAMTQLWQRAVALTGNAAIGLNLARVMRPGAMHVVGYALMSSATLKESFQRLVRYQRIIAEGADVSFEPDGGGYRLTLAIHGDRLPAARQSAEGSLASTLAFCRWLTDRPLIPLEASFEGPTPEDVEPYQALFQCPLQFSAPRHSLLFRHADLTVPLPTANPELANLHDRFAGQYLARFTDSRITHRTRQLLCRLLPEGEPRRDAVAQLLHLSERTLQRRLHEEGTSFQQLLDDTRRTLAEQYLAQPELALLEIGYLLGFADPSNFFRAFRRWHSMTPGEYRAERLAMGSELVPRDAGHRH